METLQAEASLHWLQGIQVNHKLLPKYKYKYNTQYKRQVAPIPYLDRLARDLEWHTLKFLPTLEKRIHISELHNVGKLTF